MIYLYKLLLYLLFVLSLPLLGLLYLASKKRRATLGPRLGLSLPDDTIRSKQTKRLWVHALSVGEVISAVPLVRQIKQSRPDIQIVFTASTKTGFDTANRLFLKNESNLVDHLLFFPFDLGVSIRRISSWISPDAVVLIETDVWPNFLYEMNKQQIPVVLVNARLSEKSLKGYKRFGKFFRYFFSILTMIMVQSRLDQERYLQMGIDEKKVVVTGNIKFDQPPIPMDEEAILNIKKDLGLDKKTILIAGSTHDGEEIILSRIFARLQKRFLDFAMIIAPRNPERSLKLEQFFASQKISATLLSKIKEPGHSSNVILVDSMGKLATLYSICDLAFVGGSLVPKGGHNPLEPALCSKPVLFGPDMSDFLEVADVLIAGGGAIQVTSEAILEEELENLLSDQSKQQSMGEKNHTVLMDHSGAVKQIFMQLESLNLV